MLSVETLLKRPELPVWVQLLKPPVCAELERKYVEVLKAPVTPAGVFFKGSGPALARFFKGEARGLQMFGEADDATEVIGLVKNPYGDRIWTDSGEVGVRNVVFSFGGVLYAGKAKSFGFQAVKPVAPSMQEEIRQALENALETVDVNRFPVWVKI